MMHVPGKIFKQMFFKALPSASSQKKTVTTLAAASM
jgi:hypothetical protein